MFVLLWAVCCGVLLDAACEWYQQHIIELSMWFWTVVSGVWRRFALHF